jgi:hypothetical protein
MGLKVKNTLEIPGKGNKEEFKTAPKKSPMGPMPKSP